MSGIADNFQLNVLLMDAFPRGLLSRRRVPEHAVRVARGEGAGKPGETVSGVWNLYAWTALGRDARLPDPGNFGMREHWIWNEGKPADIPVFEGHRVVLLGPPSYHRGWGLSRPFDRLKAELTVDKRMTKPDVRQWLDRMAAAPRPAGGDVTGDFTGTAG
jgi:hypothetical protein